MPKVSVLLFTVMFCSVCRRWLWRRTDTKHWECGWCGAEHATL
jgi:ribosomal protein L37AE/L43A